MKHEELSKFASPREEVERFEEVIAALEATAERSVFGPVELTGLPPGFSCTKEREDNVTDRYVFTSAGLKLILLHQRDDNTIVDPFSEPKVSELDPQDATMKQIEDDLLQQCAAALLSHLSQD